MLSGPLGLSRALYQKNKNLTELPNRITGYEHYVTTKCSCKSILFFNQVLAGLGSLISTPISGMPIEHQWVIIEANSEMDESVKKIYLLAQSSKDTLVLTPFESEKEGDAVALESASRDRDDIPLTFDTFEPSKRFTVEELYEFMKSKNREYNWLVNNCQQFVQEFCEEYSRSGYQRIRREREVDGNPILAHERSSLLSIIARGGGSGPINPDDVDPFSNGQETINGSIEIPCSVQ